MTRAGVKRIVVLAVVVLAGLVAIVLAIGSALPVGHRASVSRSVPAGQEEVFDTIAGFVRYPQWRTGVSSVEVSGLPGVGQLVRERSTNGEIPFRVEVFDRPRRLVMRIASADLAFGGTWTYALAPTPGDDGTTVTITEDGEIYNAVFRVMARYVFGYDATMRQYLDDLTSRLSSAADAR